MLKRKSTFDPRTIKEAPVFYPTTEQFVNPMHYIQVGLHDKHTILLSSPALSCALSCSACSLICCSLTISSLTISSLAISSLLNLKPLLCSSKYLPRLRPQVSVASSLRRTGTAHSSWTRRNSSFPPESRSWTAWSAPPEKRGYSLNECACFGYERAPVHSDARITVVVGLYPVREVVSNEFQAVVWVQRVCSCHVMLWSSLFYIW